MQVRLIRRAGVAVLAAAAFILAASAAADLPSIVCSFRVSGTAPPCARGIYAWSWATAYVYGVFYHGPNDNYIYEFNTSGSIVSSAKLPGAVRLGDADFAPDGYGGYVAVVDEGTHELKAYTTTGSYGGVIRTLPGDVVAYARGGYVSDYLYLGTGAGVVYRYTPTWSFLNSYDTGVALADLAAGNGYRYYWGYYLEVGPTRPGDPVRVFDSWSGYPQGSFPLPGVRNCGAVGGGDSYWCLRDTGNEIWAYGVRIAMLMAVEPASLGKVKALFK
jgi:hypothetical protein